MQKTIGENAKKFEPR